MQNFDRFLEDDKRDPTSGTGKGDRKGDDRRKRRKGEGKREREE